MLIEDEAGGTPQRVLWLACDKADQPEPQPDMYTPPGFQWEPRYEIPAEVERSNPDSVMLTVEEHERSNSLEGQMKPQIMEASPAAVHDTQHGRWLAMTGRVDVPALDSHRMLLRGKVAALLRLLDDPQATAYTDDDWRLAGIILETSCAVRDWIVSSAAERRRRESAARNQAAGGQAVVVRRFIESAEVDKAAGTISRALLKRLAEDPTKTFTANRCRQMMSPKHRKAFNVEDVLATAIDSGTIERLFDGRYRAVKD